MWGRIIRRGEWVEHTASEGRSIVESRRGMYIACAERGRESND